MITKDTAGKSPRPGLVTVNLRLELETLCARAYDEFVNEYGAAGWELTVVGLQGAAVSATSKAPSGDAKTQEIPLTLDFQSELLGLLEIHRERLIEEGKLSGQ